MVFSSLEFLFLFLPITLTGYYFISEKLRNLFLVLASLVFYAWGEPVYITIMLFSTVFDYVNGRMIVHYREKGNERGAKNVLILSIVINLGILFFFKYSGFVAYNLESLLRIDIPTFRLPLPIGISFYTFQTLSYTIDVYRGVVDAQKNIISFGMYVTLFPQLVAGPIVQYKDVEQQLTNRTVTSESFVSGIERFITGLFKKVMLANSIGLLWEQISMSHIHALSISTAWLGAIAFTFQIYFDFSGYSDMAIGLGKMFGFEFRENFNHPYKSKSITEFWRRWHISLSSWFKDYVYIPLGGSRCSNSQNIRNLFIVWFLTGLWHGASWNFIVWGLYFFCLLVIEKKVLLKYLEKIPSIFAHIYTMFFVIISWVIFAFDSLKQGSVYLQQMFEFKYASLIDGEAIYLLKNNAILLILCVIFSLGIINKKHFEQRKFIKMVIYLLMFILSICFLVGDTYNPFLYFRF